MVSVASMVIEWIVFPVLEVSIAVMIAIEQNSAWYNELHLLLKFA